MDLNNILSVVLAGGKSKRFGEDKSQVKLGEKLLVDYILSQVIEEFNEVLIVTNNPIKHIPSNKISKIHDLKQDLGPLGGIFSAMKWVRENNKSYKWIASFPVDTPLFKFEIFKKFLEKVNENESQLFFMKTNEKRHNIFGLWSIELIDQLEKDLETGSRKVEKWANSIGVKTINMSFKKDDPFFNINTKDDLIKIKKIFND